MLTESVNALPATFRSLRLLNDGGVRLQIDITASHRVAALHHFSKPNSVLQLSLPAVEKSAAKTHYGHYARLLRLSSFFRNPIVWNKIGSNDDYLAWLNQQACASCRTKTHPIDLIDTYSLTPNAAVKPLYSAIALCINCHNHSTPRSQIWLNKQRLHSVSQWAWESLKQQLGYRSWREVPPAVLRAWALQQGLGLTLPTAYRDTPPGSEHLKT